MDKLDPAGLSKELRGVFDRAITKRRSELKRGPTPADFIRGDSPSAVDVFLERMNAVGDHRATDMTKEKDKAYNTIKACGDITGYFQIEIMRAAEWDKGTHDSYASLHAALCEFYISDEIDWDRMFPGEGELPDPNLIHFKTPQGDKYTLKLHEVDTVNEYIMDNYPNNPIVCV